MGRRRGNPVHFATPEALVLGCGLGAVRRRRTATLASVECEACRTSPDFKAAERAAEKRQRFQVRCGQSGHSWWNGMCEFCGAPQGVPRG